ncbi:hypothetical protein HN840_00885 [archaeon]|jgi:hypothetical protein|nr:hypothetical protein [archaeon]MBT3730369.1 hypothetical protein [archaeon]MBT4669923.1 hypothetical protein [archaeon]MBT7052668.1 hypothetical protein [archaeon]MBT7280862.1 hypothetical protein [archaeon]
MADQDLEKIAGHKLRKSDFIPIAGIFRRQTRRLDVYYDENTSGKEALKELMNYFPGTALLLGYNAAVLAVAGTAGMATGYVLLENLVGKF